MVNKSDSRRTAQLPKEWPVSGHLRILREHLPEIQERYRVGQLWIFGSYVRNGQRPDSDLDVLVEFEETPDLFKYVNLQYYLSELLGVDVDLITRSSLRGRIGSRILGEAIAA